ncbi:16S rRNA (cytidine(1402)-2'-O)-methyltransferase [Dethiosulfatarculus sandiegensis]|uniref:Ribosomal RNA small subunit methyltransferase I n=1 Tax=Dethiosulfatarculus sandiegensis TaxID=1429043 RepID=A0A0D2GK49_9BACT|nr:16S rRNA (cytidine(1402)-2'-O)-methyltransferase [Dethiosulfatarculus sandiegensis]KIX15137.1 methyltransferase [Dethiosulfatarculus sandiegensis]
MATLFVVATPIGNLDDLTPRARRILEEVDFIAAESVGRTKKLLAHLSISGKRLISCREANRKRASYEVLNLLDQGRDVALVSDAGTPGISDPGGAVVLAVAQAGHKLTPLPGASALAAGLSVAGLPGAPVTFLGFLPAKTGARKKLLEQAKATGWPFVVYEAPHRLAATAADLLEVLGDRTVVMAREISKIHEEVAHTTTSLLAEKANASQAKGEITLIVSGGEPPQADENLVKELLSQGLLEEKEKPAKLAAKVAAKTGMKKAPVYEMLMTLKNKQGT